MAVLCILNSLPVDNRVSKITRQFITAIRTQDLLLTIAHMTVSAPTIQPSNVDLRGVIKNI